MIFFSLMDEKKMKEILAFAEKLEKMQKDERKKKTLLKYKIV